MTDKILVLGGSGMLGHKMFQVLKCTFPATSCTVRGTKGEWLAARLGMPSANDIIEGVDATNIDEVDLLLADLKPNVVVNCIGTIKQRPGAADPIESIAINSLLPHRLSRALKQWDGRLIHFSTDCVFSGARGHYVEADPSDATDLYGRSKFLGEVSSGRALTIRTSIIGRELAYHTSLLDWLLRQRGDVRGFTRSWWSGVTTEHLSRVVADIVRDKPNLNGLYHLSSGRISKYDLLLLLREAYSLKLHVEADETVFCDRSLRGDLFTEATGYLFPGWESLLTDLVTDLTDYDEISDS